MQLTHGEAQTITHWPPANWYPVMQDVQTLFDTGHDKQFGSVQMKQVPATDRVNPVKQT